MKTIVSNIYILLIFLSYVMRKAGTFSVSEKVKMIEFLSYMATNPNTKIVEHEDAETLLGEVMRFQPLRVDHLLAQSRAAKTLEHNLHPLD